MTLRKEKKQKADTAAGDNTGTCKRRRIKFIVIPAVILLALGAVALFCFTPATTDPIAAPENSNGDDWLTVAIDAAAPKIGTPLCISYDEDQIAAGTTVTYRWLRGEKTLPCDTRTYTPTQDDVEQWLTVCVLADGVEIGRDSVWFSELPVCYIDTDDGEAVISKTESKTASLFIQGNDDYDAQYDGAISIHARGNSTYKYDKKPYKIKLDKKTDLFGFGKSKHYVLLANYVDESLMRTAIGVELEKILGITYSECIWVDVVLNGAYIGNYQLCEHVRVGKNIVDVFDWDDYAEETADALLSAVQADNPELKKSELEDLMVNDLSWLDTGTVTVGGVTYDIESVTGEEIRDVDSGYLFAFAYKQDDDAYKFVTKRYVGITVNNISGIEGSESMLSYVHTFMQEAEDALYGENGYNELGRHYSEYFNVDSMVNYWLLAELSGGRDNLRGSVYCYIDDDGKITYGPGWDFDLSYRRARSLIATAATDGTDWLAQVTDDPYFQVKVQERYWEIRDQYAALFEKDGWYDQNVDALSDAIAANRTVWRYRKIGRVTLLFLGNSYMRHFFANRIAWADNLFATDKTLTKRLVVDAQLYPYQASSKLTLEPSGLSADTAAHGADYLTDGTAALTLDVTTKCPDAATYCLYVNGIAVYTIDAKEIGQPLTVTPELLTEPIGKKNVLVLSAYDAEGNRVASNYITIKVQ